MKTNALLLSTESAILSMMLTFLETNAQITFQGLATDHEGIAAWNADGTGPEPAADGIDPHPDAAMAQLLDDINGFPLFVQALADNGFSPGQVKIKVGLINAKNDTEGEDWFTFNGKHYFNKYDGTYSLELTGELMISGYCSYTMCSYDTEGLTAFSLMLPDTLKKGTRSYHLKGFMPITRGLSRGMPMVAARNRLGRVIHLFITI
jgi:hypothetical protein